MKNLCTLVILTITLSISVFAQTPQSFKYQAVVRDVSGNVIPNQLVALKISLLVGSESGLVVYSEIHNGTTNQFGLISLDIGNGTVETGIFSAIDWRLDNYFLKLEIDATGGSDFQFMGTSQLLSVPYALHTQTSEKFPTITSAIRDTMTIIAEGACFYNSTTKRLNFYNGETWFELLADCTPALEQAIAGSDQNGIIGATAILQGNSYLSTTTAAWNIISGTGGYIVEPSNPSGVFYGAAGNSYTLTWTFSNSCGSTVDTVVLSFAPFNCGQSFADERDFKVYNSILIGTQCWMVQNINIGTRVEGNVNMSNNSTIEKYCNSNLESNCDVYGGLYQWSEMMQYVTTEGSQGICFPGWHIPTDTELKTLEGTIDSQYGVGDPIWDLTGDRGLDAGGNMKETGTTHWVYPNTGATNSSGFTALPGGARNTDGTYPGFQIYGRYWTSSESATNAYRRILSASSADISRDDANKNFGLSVRCIKN